LPVESQQPVAQEPAVQTQVPVASQVSPSPQGAQAPPPFPQAAVVGVWHLPLESQHPFGQELALQMHAPPLQL
jgi:hypothetical protein